MKKYLIVVLIVSLVIGIPLLLFIGGGIKNDRLLRSMERDLKDVLSDHNIEIIELKSVCGKLSGNGNGMDFFVAALVKSTKEECVPAQKI